MKKSLLFVALSILILPVFIFSQEDTKKEENPPTIPVTYPVVSPPILLPDKSDSWAINVHTEGGIMGIKYLVFALNSEGKYQCGEKGELKTLTLTSESFLEVGKTIKEFQTSFYAKGLSDKSLYCNDCVYSSLSLYLTTRTEKSDNKSKQTDTKKDELFLQKSETQKVKDIYTKALKAVDCNAEPKKDPQDIN